MNETNPPKCIWVLIDISNGGAGVDRGVQNYLRWFFTRKAAREHMAYYSGPQYADLVGPFKYYAGDRK